MEKKIMLLLNELPNFVERLTDDELLALVRAVRKRLADEGSVSRPQGAMDEEESDSLLDYLVNSRSADEFSEQTGGLTDVTKQLSESQRVALFTLLTYVEPEERGVDWDEENPEEFDDIELSRLCFVKAWPANDWNQRIYAGSNCVHDENGDFVCDEKGYPVTNANRKAESDRQAALLEVFRPACAEDE